MMMMVVVIMMMMMIMIRMMVVETMMIMMIVMKMCSLHGHKISVQSIDDENYILMLFATLSILYFVV